MTIFIVKDKSKDNFKDYIKEELDYLDITSHTNVSMFDVYESDKEILGLEKILGDFKIYENLDEFNLDGSFRFRTLPGQFDEHEEMINQLSNKFLSNSEDLHYSQIISFTDIDKEDFEKFKDYFINEIEKEIVDFTSLDYSIDKSQGENLKVINGFRNLDNEVLEKLTGSYSMNLEDLKFVRNYFKSENRDPSIFELKVIDTYWSDHCRHTTFNTELKDIEVLDSCYKDTIESTLEEYLNLRKDLYKYKNRKVSLMDMGTINARYEISRSNLNDLEESDEVNACTVNIKVDIDGKDQDWLLMFKNETHNHPTEIEPFGGASTCVGGCIRDPLSGRAHVHQAMRITGAKNPKTPYSETLDNKLPQRTICKKSMEGSADYGNKYGIPLGYIKEYYDDNYQAKRMEVGAMVAAAPKENVIRETPTNGDLIVLIGGKTGRDGLGAAVGSSVVQNSESLKLQGSEVQKGNPIIQRKIQRLFRNPQATKLIKKCNDCGAGGVAVAIGELAHGLEIYLDQVIVKYPGLDPYEIALSESQERMALVIGQEYIEDFIELSKAEDLNPAIVGKVTDSDYMIMKYDQEEVLKISKSFLDSNGASRSQQVKIDSKSIKGKFIDDRNIVDQLKDINNASQKPLGRHFDSTVGKNIVLNPYGGDNRITQQLGMASKIPVYNGNTKTVSLMTMAFAPQIFKKSTYHGGYYSVVESVAKIIALGGKKESIRLSIQEYFPSLRDDPKRWGLPAGALLGAFQGMYDLNIPAIGGKDSMSGSFEDIDVVPTLISFAVTTSNIERINSRELKNTDSNILLVGPKLDSNDLIKKEDLLEVFDYVERLIDSGQIRSISTLDNKTIELNLVEMALGNKIGIEINKDFLNKIYPATFLIEVSKDFESPYPIVGNTNNSTMLSLDKDYDLDELMETYLSPLEEVYGKVSRYESKITENNFLDRNLRADIKVLIPILTGTYGEYDLYKELKKYTNYVEFYHIKDDIDFEQSIINLSKIIKDYNILAFADGACYGNHPENGKAIELLLRHDYMRDAINKFVENGYILGFGNSSLGLISSGLIENSKIGENKDISFIKNTKNSHISEIVDGKVLDERYSERDYYTSIISSDTLRININTDKYKKQIISKISFGNEEFVDGFMDETGHIIGFISNIERFDKDGIINVGYLENDFLEKIIEKVANKQ